MARADQGTKMKVVYQLENGVEDIICHMANSTTGKESLEKKH